MILGMGKRKKNTAAIKASKKVAEAKLPQAPFPQNEDSKEDESLSFGILPNRDLKKNLGCG